MGCFERHELIKRIGKRYRISYDVIHMGKGFIGHPFVPGAFTYTGGLTSLGDTAITNKGKQKTALLGGEPCGLVCIYGR